MPFRWFKQHEKTLMYFVAFFIMPTFLIGIGAYAFFGNIGQAQTVAKYELVPGETTKVSRDEVQDMARRFNNNNIPALAATKARIDEAKLAGIYVSKEELKARIELILQNAFPGGYTANQYKGLIAQQGLSISQFERSMRDQLMVERLASLKRTERRSTSSEVFNAWARDNTRVTLDYISFSAEDIAKEMDVFEIKPEEVSEFYERAKENPAEYGWALERYTTPQKWDLEALFVQFEGFDPAAHEDLVGDVEEPTEDEMRAYYERRIAWFTPEAEAEDPDADVPEPTPFEDVQDEIKTRLIVERGMERVYDALLEEQINNDAVDLEDFAGNEGVFYHRLTGKEASELEADDVIGYDGLPIDLSQLQAGDLSRGVVTERKDGVFVLRVNRIKEPDFKPEQAVDVLLREDIIVERSREEARLRARNFHQEAEDWIEKKIKEERGEVDDPANEDEDADDAPETPADQVAMAELEEEKRNRMGEAFDALVEADPNLQMTRIGPRKLIQLGAPEAQEIEDPAVKYLLTAGMVKTLDEGDVQGNSLFDRENYVGYVVRMVEKGEPDPSEMPEADYRDYLQQRLFSQIQTASQFQQFREQQWLQQIKLSGPGIPTAGSGTGGIPGAPR